MLAPLKLLTGPLLAMVNWSSSAATALAVAAGVAAAPSADPCAVIGGQKWVAPSDVRACFECVADYYEEVLY